MNLKNVPMLALSFLLVAVSTGKFFTKAEFRQVRKATVAGKTLEGKSLDYIADHHITDPGVVISIENQLDGTELKGGKTYESYGKVKLAPPKKIDAGTQEIMAFDRLVWGQGASGMVAYKIMDSKQPVRFVIAFSVPWSHLFSRNWYGLRVIDDDQSLDADLFSRISKKHWYTHSATNQFAFAKSGGDLKIQEGPYVVTASMSTSKRAILHVTVSKKGGSDE